MMYDAKQSDAGIVAEKVANNGERSSAELLEQRPATEGKPQSAGMVRSQNRSAMSPGAERLRQFVRENPQERLTALLHHITPETLKQAYLALKRDAAAGADGMTWREYADGLDERLLDLHGRVHRRGAYRATPARLVEIPKPGGGRRPLGIASLEDKIVQRAVVDNILNPIYESEFAGFSHGFRPGRSAHDALDALAYVIERRKVNWIVEVDIRQYFERIDRKWLRRFLEYRIGDRRVVHLIEKWLNAGVMDAGHRVDRERGIPQGAVISPILANIYLHYVLDLWFARKWRKHEARGEAYMVRYADDFVLGFQHRDDAGRFLHAVSERLAEFGLELHPEKTRLLEFGRFASANRAKRRQRRPETFDFLGFTHYWRKQRNGRTGLRRKPMAKRVSRTLRAVKLALRKRMNADMMDTGKWLARVLRGWLGYYAVPGSVRWLREFERSVRRLWLRSLQRRSQRRRISWTHLLAICQHLWPRVRVLHPWPTERFAVNHPK